MASTGLRVGVVGSGPSAGALAGRLRAVEGVTLVGFADADADAARALSGSLSHPDRPIPAFGGHAELIRSTSPDALAIFNPHPMHYRPAMDALQAGCHVLIESPLSTVAQEAVDVAGLARARGLKVAVWNHFRLLPSLARARELLAEGAVGQVRLISATLAMPDRDRPEWEYSADPTLDLLDALLWSAGRPAESVAAIRPADASGSGASTSASVALAGGVAASLAISGPSAAGGYFEIAYHGEGGRLRASRRSLLREWGPGRSDPVPLGGPAGDVASNFVEAIRSGAPLCCPAEESLDSVRLLEAIARSATIGQFVGLA